MNVTNLLRNALNRPSVVDKKTLDSAMSEQDFSPGDDYTLKDISMSTVAAIQQWTETDDLDDGESLSDRLMALLVGIADANKDGDITEDEQGVLEVALNAAWDYFVKCGVSEDDADMLLNEWDSDVAERVRDLVASTLPDGEDASNADIDSFVFSDEDQEPALDAVYRKRMVIRGGQKMRINKRISGKVRLSAKQKVAIRKARMKSHSAGAMMRRLKSMRMRRRVGL
jgi:hypothetical protein